MPVAQGCTITRVPLLHCEHKRKLTRHLPPVAELYVPYTHSNCIRNEYVAMRERVVGKVPLPSNRGLMVLREAARALARKLPKMEPMSYNQYLQHFTGRKRTRYQNALDSLRHTPLDIGRESMIKAFVKAEKFDPGAKVNPPPRMIQARSARFNISIGRFLRPVEKYLYKLKSPAGLRMIGKGLNLRARAELLVTKMGRFKSPVVYSLDCRRWDQHVHIELLKMEAYIFLKAICDPEFRQLLQAQQKNKCMTQNGIKYKTLGRRMSGDVQTALGNCLLMLLCVLAACKMIGLIDYELLDDGDDCLLILEQHNEWRISKLQKWFLEFGHELKLENRSTTVSGVVWCQTKPVCVDGSWRFVADWRKTLSSATSGVRYWHEPKTRFDMAFSVGQCLLALYNGVPILGKFASKLCSFGGKINDDVYQIDMFYKVRAEKLEIGKLTACQPSTETRLSFQEAYGLSALEQIAIEERLDTFSITSGIRDVPLEVTGEWCWSYALGTEPVGL